MAALPHHDDEVCNRRGVDRSAGARPHDRRDLGDDAGGEGIAREDLGVPGEAGDAFLDAGPAGVVEPDDRRADLHRQVHQFADLLGVALGEGAAEDGKVLGEDEDGSPVDPTVPGDNPVPRDLLLRHPEVLAAVLNQLADLLEAAAVEEGLDPFPGGQLAVAVVAGDPVWASPQLGPPILLFQCVAFSLAHARSAPPSRLIHSCQRR